MLCHHFPNLGARRVSGALMGLPYVGVCETNGKRQEIEDLNVMHKFDRRLERLAMVMPLTDHFDPGVTHFAHEHLQVCMAERQALAASPVGVQSCRPLSAITNERPGRHIGAPTNTAPAIFYLPACVIYRGFKPCCFQEGDKISVPASILSELIRKQAEVPWQFELKLVRRKAPGQYEPVDVPPPPREVSLKIKRNLLNMPPGTPFIPYLTASCVRWVPRWFNH